MVQMAIETAQNLDCTLPATVFAVLSRQDTFKERGHRYEAHPSSRLALPNELGVDLVGGASVRDLR